MNRLRLPLLIAFAGLVFGTCGGPMLAQSVVPKSSIAPQKAGKSLVDLNRATIFDLEQLPGIGGAEADKIIHGRPYRAKADLLARRILTPSVYDQISPLVITKVSAVKPAPPKCDD
jgi:DNA uptake protein ComE-like DNA-binding protein